MYVSYSTGTWGLLGELRIARPCLSFIRSSHRRATATCPKENRKLVFAQPPEEEHVFLDHCKYVFGFWHWHSENSALLCYDGLLLCIYYICDIISLRSLDLREKWGMKVVMFFNRSTRS